MKEKFTSDKVQKGRVLTQVHGAHVAVSFPVSITRRVQWWNVSTTSNVSAFSSEYDHSIRFFFQVHKQLKSECSGSEHPLPFLEEQTRKLQVGNILGISRLLIHTQEEIIPLTASLSQSSVSTLPYTRPEGPSSKIYGRFQLGS